MSTPADRNYSNAARAGRTSPGEIELGREAKEPRVVMNRADYRRQGYRHGPTVTVIPKRSRYGKERTVTTPAPLRQTVRLRPVPHSKEEA